MNKRPGHVVVTTEVGVCSFCGRPRTLRREEHQLGALVRTIVTCESCHRTLSSTMGVASAEPATPETVATEAEPTSAPAATAPAAKGVAARPAAKRAAWPKPAATAAKSAASKSRAPKQGK